MSYFVFLRYNGGEFHPRLPAYKTGARGAELPLYQELLAVISCSTRLGAKAFDIDL